MFNFRPARSSPPLKPAPVLRNYPSSAQSADASRSSAISNVPELAGLSAEDVALIDAIIERAGPTATTFLTVFKAYNDILLERGLDPHEVVYYGKLLKLGTLKGSSWSEKWDAIRAQNGYGIGKRTVVVASRKTPGIMTPPKQLPRSYLPSQATLTDDIFSIGEGMNDSQLSESDVNTIPDTTTALTSSMNKFHPRRVPSPSDLTGNSLGLEFDDHPLLSAPTAPRFIPQSRISRPRAYEPSEHVASTSSTTPPSYRAAVRDGPTSTILPESLTKRTELRAPAKIAAATSQLKPRRGSIINEEDAWKKVRMAQDEKEADRFRDERLVERCFDTWRQGFRWIIDTNEQIAEARDNLILRKFMQIWSHRAATRRAYYEQVDLIANKRCLRTFLKLWKLRLKEKHQVKRRRDMRMKIHVVRQKRELKLRKDAWAKWRQSYQSHLGDQHYAEQLAIRFFQLWRVKLGHAREQNAIATEMHRGRQVKAIEKCWDHWRLSTELARTQKSVTERVELRVMAEAMETWKQKTRDSLAAQSFYKKILTKQTMRVWKDARSRIRALEARADKHLDRQDDVLLRAVMRVWKAHERGKLLERVKAFRLTKTAWSLWKARVQAQRSLEAQALGFSARLNSSAAMIALRTWHASYVRHQNAQLLADQYCSAQVLHRGLLLWRINLHKQFKMVKKARMAEKYIILRKAWTLLKDKYDERIKNAKLQLLERKKLKTVFDRWLHQTQRQRQQRLAERLIQDRVHQRILSTRLTHWTNRVIGLKLRELETSQRHDLSVLIMAFNKWRNLRRRHVEELSLMESYQDVKREEMVRRVFCHWHTAARAARHRRLLLQQKEEDLKFTIIAAAWDKWRERFKDERLRPLEYKFSLQNTEALKYRAFAVWRFKTQSLPAINFHTKRVKSSYWKLWLSAMPRALQAKKAREMDKGILLKKSFAKWIQVYRTKLSLKAVARARYFPAPSAPPVRTPPVSRPFVSSFSYAARSNFPRRITRVEYSDEDDSRPSRPGLTTRLLPSKARSEVSPTRTLISMPGTRDPSPARSAKSTVPTPWYARERSPIRPAPPSSTGGFEGRSRLWQEIQEVRRKSQTPSEKSRPREPP